MLNRSLLLAVAVVFTTAIPGVAQTSASARATLVVGELMTLRVVSGGSGAEVVPAGTVAKAGSEPVLLEVAANRTWQLHVAFESSDGRTWSAGAVATGGPGRTPVELNYARLAALSGAQAGGDPDLAVRLTLSPI